MLLIGFALEGMAALCLFLWYSGLRSDAAVLDHALSQCPVCQTNGDVMDFNESEIGKYCNHHFAHWMRIRERERRIATHVDWEDDDEEVR